MRRLRPALPLLALALLPGCVVAAHSGFGHGYGRSYGHARPYDPAPAYRPWQPPRRHWGSQGPWHGYGWHGYGWRGHGRHGHGRHGHWRR